MATLSNRNGSRVIQFTMNGQRRTITLGRCDKSTSQTIRTHVGRLVVAAITNTTAPVDTANWLAGIGDALHHKLACVELVTSRQTLSRLTLEDMLRAYVARRTGNLKSGPLYNLERTKRSLCQFFGPDRDPRTINIAEAEDYRRNLATSYAQPTVSARIKKTRQMFTDAQKRKTIDFNPFSEVRAGAQTNRARMQYVSVVDIERVIDGCPDHEWRMLFALSRYAGVRIPSEINGMLWQDINWKDQRILIRSPKTEHLEGRATRTAPIVPKLMEHLRAGYIHCGKESGHVFVLRRGINVGTTARKLVLRADVRPWPRMFQNLRSSCQTDFAAKFPLHVACAWIGNSETVANDHYLQVSDEFFVAATSAASGAAIDTVVNRAAGNTALSRAPDDIKNAGSRPIEQEPEVLMTPRGFEPLSPP